MKTLSTFLFSFLFIIGLNTNGLAQITHTSGGGWSNGTGPTSSTAAQSVTIQSGTATLNDNAKMSTLIIEPGAGVTYSGSTSVDITLNLEIQGSAHLTIDGTGAINMGGNLTIADKGALAITSSGSISVGGTSSVSITGYNSSNGYNSWAAMFSGLGLESTMGSPTPCDIYAYDSQLQDWKYDYSMPYSTTCNTNAVTFTAAAHGVTDRVSDGNFDVGLGYFVPGSSTATRIFTASGAPINGTVNVQINGTSLSRVDGNDWNLLGNPYPSGLSIDAFLADNSAIVGTSVYIFNNSIGDYDGPFTNGDGEVLAAGQAFMVDPNTTSDGDLGDATFKNSYRLTDNSTFRSSSFSQAFISFSSEQGNYHDKLRVMFDMNCSNGKDHVRDARKLNSADTLNLGAYIDSSIYAINGIQPLALNESFTMDLYVTTPKSGVYKLELDSIQNITNHDWVIKDKLTGFSHTLNNGPFTISVNAAMEFTNRYQLIITNQDWTTSVQDIESQWFSCLCANNNIFVDGLGNQLKSVTVIDLSGRIIAQQQGVNNTTINIPTTNIPNGIYLVTIEGKNGNIQTLKTVIQ